MSSQTPCGICGRGPHRYGTTDPEHKYDAMGCVNMLLPLVEQLRAALDVARLELANHPLDGSVANALTVIDHALAEPVRSWT